MSGFPYQPIVMDSVMEPIARGWLRESNTQHSREAFWKFKRARLLGEAIPAEPDVIMSMIRGWYVAKALGRLVVDPTMASAVRSWRSGMPHPAAVVDFPHPLLSARNAAPHDFPGIVMQSLTVALALCNSEGSLDAARAVPGARRAGRRPGRVVVGAHRLDPARRRSIKGAPVPKPDRAGTAAGDLVAAAAGAAGVPARRDDEVPRAGRRPGPQRVGLRLPGELGDPRAHPRGAPRPHLGRDGDEVRRHGGLTWSTVLARGESEHRPAAQRRAGRGAARARRRVDQDGPARPCALGPARAGRRAGRRHRRASTRSCSASAATRRSRHPHRSVRGARAGGARRRPPGQAPLGSARRDRSMRSRTPSPSACATTCASRCRCRIPSANILEQSTDLKHATLICAPTEFQLRQRVDWASGEFGVVVVASPEDRSSPWSGDAFVRENERFVGFTLMHLASVAGLWNGVGKRELRTLPSRGVRPPERVDLARLRQRRAHRVARPAHRGARARRRRAPGLAARRRRA